MQKHSNILYNIRLTMNFQHFEETCKISEKEIWFVAMIQSKRSQNFLIYFSEKKNPAIKRENYHETIKKTYGNTMASLLYSNSPLSLIHIIVFYYRKCIPIPSCNFAIKLSSLPSKINILSALKQGKKDLLSSAHTLSMALESKQT